MVVAPTIWNSLPLELLSCVFVSTFKSKLKTWLHGKTHKFLSVDSAKTLVHAVITSTVDYCNSLLYGQPKCVLRDL